MACSLCVFQGRVQTKASILMRIPVSAHQLWPWTSSRYGDGVTRNQSLLYFNCNRCVALVSFLVVVPPSSSCPLLLIQIITGLLFLSFNNSKARAVHLGARLDHDYLLAGLSTTTANLLQTALNCPSVFLELDRLPVPARRTLEELTAAGYVVKPKLHDPFTPEQIQCISDALRRYVSTNLRCLH